MPFCTQCGNNVGDNADFCAKCGTKVGADAPPPPPPKPVKNTGPIGKNGKPQVFVGSGANGWWVDAD